LEQDRFSISSGLSSSPQFGQTGLSTIDLPLSMRRLPTKLALVEEVIHHLHPSVVDALD
jgi:hypothetical protein